MNFRSVAQLSDQILAWSKQLPQDIDLVVGIPRSGLLVANLLAIYRNLPLTDLDGLLSGRVLVTGQSKWGALCAGDATPDAQAVFLRQPRSVLVLDDTVGSGKTLEVARARIADAGLPHRVRYGAVYVAPDREDAVDFYAQVLPFPRIFEWNVLNHSLLSQSCLDIDGVLCFDPPHENNDDGERYRHFLENARPLYRPTAFVGTLVTSRLERYRPETEAWLKRHQIAYGKLVMLDYPNRETRMHLNTYSAHKAQAYRASGAVLFIESEIRQAVEIATLARKPVLCTDTMQMIYPGSLPVLRPVPPAVAPPQSLPRRIAKTVLSDSALGALRSLRNAIRLRAVAR